MTIEAVGAGLSHLNRPQSTEIAGNEKQQGLRAEGPAEASPAAAEAAEGGERAGLPRYDEYIKGDGKEAEGPGTYSPAYDEEGNPKITFDGPVGTDQSKQSDKGEKAEDKDGAAPGSDDKKAGEKDGGPSGPEGKKDKECTVNTDRVDAEIKKLKEEKKKLEAEIKQAEGNEEKTKQLETRLSQVEAELQSKDNDNYRKQHADYTYQ